MLFWLEDFSKILKETDSTDNCPYLVNRLSLKPFLST